MPVERRIREGAHRNAGVLDPDVDRFLDSVVRRTRRRTLVHRTLVAVTVIPAVVLAIVVGPKMLDGFSRSGQGQAASQQVPSATPSPSVAPGAPPLTGTFTRTLKNNLAVVQANGIAGTWTISADSHGRVRLVSPASFAGAGTSRVFEMATDTLSTDAFGGNICSSYPAGTYRWMHVDRYLILRAISDPCDARVFVLTSGSWASPS